MVKLRVAIIGAGSAGLSMCKALINEQQIQCVIFEKSDKVGGSWVYTKDIKKQNHNENHHDINHNHNPLYKNLRTNLPKELMAYPGFPFPKDLTSYVSREVVLKYLEDYCDHFGLRKLINFQHEVVSVKPCVNKEKVTSWQIITKDVRNGGSVFTGVFDAVVVCNGHFSHPRIPVVAGLKDFPGTVMHSFHYNEPDDFKNKAIMILGAKNSGIDLCFQIMSVARKVYMVHLGDKLAATLPENVEEVIGTLTHGYSDGSVEINDECRVMVDCVIFCTGYDYSFPFVTPECKIEVINNRITSLYKHIFNTAYPSLSFVGLCKQTLPFPNFALQSEWVASILTGRKVLPSREEMVKDEEMDYQERLDTGVGPRYMHSLGIERFWKYNKLVAELAGVPPLSPTIWSLFNYVISERRSHLLNFRNTNFTLTDNQWFVNK